MRREAGGWSIVPRKDQHRYRRTLADKRNGPNLSLGTPERSDGAEGYSNALAAGKW